MVITFLNSLRSMLCLLAIIWVVAITMCEECRDGFSTVPGL